MRRKIPSSAALLAFEAAARHGNFARAAAELALTEGAISRQIARLEALLDSKLFDRTGSRVRLNPAGARYARQVREILARLERDTHDVSGMPVDGRSLEIAVLPTFASRWLIPRLGRSIRISWSISPPAAIPSFCREADLMPPSILNTRRGPEWR